MCVERLANYLCEMSRDLICRVNRVTVPQISAMIEAFESAVQGFSTTTIKDHEVAGRTKRYIEHISKRIEMLKKQIR